MVECKKRSMKHIVDFPHFGEVELIYNGGKNFDNGAGVFLIWG